MTLCGTYEITYIEATVDKNYKYLLIDFFLEIDVQITN